MPFSAEWVHQQSNELRKKLGLRPILLPHEQDDRVIHPHIPEASAQFCDNVVTTSRYTWYNFVPVFLFNQFTRFANAYFLCVAILQTIPEISITNGVPTTFLPLSIVLGFDGLVTAREDYKRHQDDAKANASQTLVIRNGRFTKTQWRHIRVGDLVKIMRNEAVPADCVFLSSFSPDADTPDACYVQTAQLDGETNLKLRQAVQATADYFRGDEDCARFRGCITCEPPNASFEKFIGTIDMRPKVWVGDQYSKGANGSASSSSSSRPASMKQHQGVAAADPDAGVALTSMVSSASNDSGGDHSSGGSADTPSGAGAGGAETGVYPLEAEQTLLRGSIIRNVDYVYAMVVYTGRETKVRVRQTSSIAKKAQVETEINRFIIVLVGLLVVFCLTGTLGAVQFTDTHQNVAYLGIGGDDHLSFVQGLRQLFTYFLLNAAFIPVSLYVTMRLARSLQMIFMEGDGEMYHSEPEVIRKTNGLEGHYPFKVRSMDLNDELGQITHIFSDKTGTLTLNFMEFRKLMINGVAYGLGSTQIGIDRLRREGKDVSQLIALLEQEKIRGRPPGCLPHVNFTDGSETHPGRTLAGDASNPRDGRQGTAIHDFFCHLALNHTVLSEVVRDNDGNIIGSRLSASSPDEEAFLMAAETCGYKFHGRTHETVTLRCKFPAHMLPLALAGPNASKAPAVRTPGSDLSLPGGGCLLTFKILNILAYSQERKRMSVIVEHPCYDEATGEVVAGGAGGGGDIYLLCKGADAAIFPRLAPTFQDTLQVRTTKRELAEWGSDGLRTLVFAGKKLGHHEYARWAKQFTAACTDIEQIRLRKAKQPNKIDGLMNDMETGMVLMGATANEDKLQPEVPETIAQLSRAGIKVWMVTGDKQETAVNIGFATRLLDDTMRQIVATVESAGDVKQAVKRIRVGAKRLRAERIRAAQMDAAAKTGVENAFEWMTKRLEVLESSLGFSVAQSDAVNESRMPELPASTLVYDPPAPLRAAADAAAADVASGSAMSAAGDDTTGAAAAAVDPASGPGITRQKSMGGARQSFLATAFGKIKVGRANSTATEGATGFGGGGGADASTTGTKRNSAAVSSPVSSPTLRPLSPPRESSTAMGVRSRTDTGASAFGGGGTSSPAAAGVSGGKNLAAMPSSGSREEGGAASPTGSISKMNSSRGGGGGGASGRPRGESFESEEGEVEETGDLDKPFVHQNAGAGAAAGAKAGSEGQTGSSASASNALNLLKPIAEEDMASPRTPHLLLSGATGAGAGGSASGGASTSSSSHELAGAARRLGPLIESKEDGGGDSHVGLRDDSTKKIGGRRLAAANPNPAPVRLSAVAAALSNATNSLPAAAMRNSVGGGDGGGYIALASSAQHSSSNMTTSTDEDNNGALTSSSGSTAVSASSSVAGSVVGGGGASEDQVAAGSGELQAGHHGYHHHNNNDVRASMTSTASSSQALVNKQQEGDSAAPAGKVSDAPLTTLPDVSAESRRMAKGNKGSSAVPDLPPPRPPAFDEAEIIAKLTSPLLGSQRRPYALIIDEGTLDAALSHPRSRAYLLYVSVNCAAVICCRARPDQKARVVKLIRDGVPHSRTLAVGDGANDVDMIRQAHVGVGISGAEGVQAANASDYSIGRFRFLQRLLLVHGRWNYHRMARLVLYTFYKNLVFVGSQFWFSTQTGFSGQKFYVEYGNQTFNLLYTSLPLLMFGVYDKDLWADVALRYPKLYDLGRLNKVLNVRVFLSWFINAIAESLLIFFVCMHAYSVPDAPLFINGKPPASDIHGAKPNSAAVVNGPNAFGPGYPNGVTPYVFQLGTVVFSCVIAVVSMRAAAEMHTHHWWFQFFTFGSAIIWIPCMWLFDSMNNDDMRGGAILVFGSATFWFTLFLVLAITTARLIAWKGWKRFYQPDLRHIVQEAQSLTHDWSSVDTYTEAADIARRTGKTVAEVYRAADLTQAAVAAIELRKQSRAALFSSPTSPSRGLVGGRLSFAGFKNVTPGKILDNVTPGLEGAGSGLMTPLAAAGSGAVAAGSGASHAGLSLSSPSGGYRPPEPAGIIAGTAGTAAGAASATTASGAAASSHFSPLATPPGIYNHSLPLASPMGIAAATTTAASAASGASGSGGLGSTTARDLHEGLRTASQQQAQHQFDLVARAFAGGSLAHADEAAAAGGHSGSGSAMSARSALGGTTGDLGAAAGGAMTARSAKPDGMGMGGIARMESSEFDQEEEGDNDYGYGSGDIGRGISGIIGRDDSAVSRRETGVTRASAASASASSPAITAGTALSARPTLGNLEMDSASAMAGAGAAGLFVAPRSAPARHQHHGSTGLRSATDSSINTFTPGSGGLDSAMEGGRLGGYFRSTGPKPATAEPVSAAATSGGGGRVRVDSSAVFSDAAALGLKLPAGIGQQQRHSIGASTTSHHHVPGESSSSLASSATASTTKRRLFDLEKAKLAALPKAIAKGGSRAANFLLHPSATFGAGAGAGAGVGSGHHMEGSGASPENLISGHEGEGDNDDDKLAKAMQRLSAARGASSGRSGGAAYDGDLGGGAHHPLLSGEHTSLPMGGPTPTPSVTSTTGTTFSLSATASGMTRSHFRASSMPSSSGGGSGPHNIISRHHVRESITGVLSAVRDELTGAHQDKPLTVGPSLDALQRLNLETQRTFVNRASKSSASAAAGGAASPVPGASSDAGVVVLLGPGTSTAPSSAPSAPIGSSAFVVGGQGARASSMSVDAAASDYLASHFSAAGVMAASANASAAASRRASRSATPSMVNLTVNANAAGGPVPLIPRPASSHLPSPSAVGSSSLPGSRPASTNLGAGGGHGGRSGRPTPQPSAMMTAGAEDSDDDDDDDGEEDEE